MDKKILLILMIVLIAIDVAPYTPVIDEIRAHNWTREENIAACMDIAKSFDRNHCLKVLAFDSKDVSICDLHTNQFECISTYAEYNKDPIACGGLSEGKGRDLCIYRAVLRGADASHCEKMTTGIYDMSSCKKNSPISSNPFWIGQIIKEIMVILSYLIALYVIFKKIRWKKLHTVYKGTMIGLVFWGSFIVSMLMAHIFNFDSLKLPFLHLPFGILLSLFVYGSTSLTLNKFLLYASVSFLILVIPFSILGAIHHHRKRSKMAIILLILLSAYTVFGYFLNSYIMSRLY